MRRIFLSLFVIIVVSAENPYCKLHCLVGDKLENNTVCLRGKEKCGAGPYCGDDFKAVQLDDDLRSFILELHNQLRNRVASGGEGRGNQPSASNMKMMKYDEDLEYVAQCLSNSCVYKRDACRRTERYEHVGQNMGGKAKEYSVRQELKLLIVDWYDEVAQFRNEWVSNVPDRSSRLFSVHNYSQMMNAQSEAVGCGLTHFSEIRDGTKRNYVYLVCNYGPGGNDSGRHMYEKGTPCTKCPKGCDRMYRSLCKA